MSARDRSARIEEVRTEDGAVLHVTAGVAGRPVMLLHGLGYVSWAAELLRTSLRPELALCTVDNRGTGRSTRGASPISIEVLARDAAEVLTSLGGAEPMPVIGYSMGGYIAQLLAVTRPDLVSAVILIGTSGGGASAVPVPEPTRRAWLDAAHLPPEEYAARTMPLSFREGWPAAHPVDYERILSARLEHPTSPEVWREQYDACECFLRDGYDRSALTAPVLILHGAADRVVPVENGRALARLLPHARYREVPGAGHLLHLEQLTFVADEIRRFLSTTNHNLTTIRNPTAIRNPTITHNP